MTQQEAKGQAAAPDIGGDSRAEAATPPRGGRGRLRAIAPWLLAAVAAAIAATASHLGPANPAAAALALIPLLVAVCLYAGNARRKAEAARGWIDPATGLYSSDGLIARGGRLLAAARARGRPVTLALFECSDLLEVRRIYGPGVAGRVGLRVADRLARVAGRGGLVARTGVTDFAVLLPGRGADVALRAIQRVLGAPARVEYESGRDEVVVLPELVLVEASATDDVARLRESALRQLIANREREARRQRQLRRARERHSQPGALSRDEAIARRERALARTVPLPLMASP